MAKSKVAKKAKSKAKVKVKSKVKTKPKIKAKTSKKAKTKVQTNSKTKAKAVAKPKLVGKTTNKKTSTKTGNKSGKKSTSDKSAKLVTSSKGKIQAKASTKVSKNATGKFTWNQMLTPLDDRLLVEISNGGERVTAGGIIIPDTVAITGQKKGTVVVAGRGHRNKKGFTRPMDVQVGDQVLFEEYAGTEIEILGQKVLLLRESDILGIED